MTKEQIIAAIQGFSRETGLSPSTITERAVGNSRLYARMVGGGDCTTTTAEKLLAFMAQNPPSQTSGGADR